MDFERTSFTRRLVQLQSRCKHKGNCPRRKNEISKGKAPKVPVRQESQIQQFALISRRRNAKRNPHAVIGTHLTARITHRKVDTNGGTCVYSSTEAKLVKKHMVKEQFPYNRKRHRNPIVF